MKRLLLLGFVILLVSSVAGAVSFAEVYWDRSNPPEEAIKDGDFRLKFDRYKPPRSLGDRGVYDNFEVPDTTIRSSDPDEQPQAQVQTQTQPQTPPGTPIRTTTQPRNQTRDQQDLAPRPTERTTRPPETVRSTRVLPKPQTDVSPRAAETIPGASDLTTGPEPTVTESRTPEQAPPPAPQATEERPSSKKMQWGQREVKPEEPKAETKTEERKPLRFQWGDKK